MSKDLDSSCYWELENPVSCAAKGHPGLEAGVCACVEITDTCPLGQNRVSFLCVYDSPSWEWLSEGFCEYIWDFGNDFAFGSFAAALLFSWLELISHLQTPSLILLFPSCPSNPHPFIFCLLLSPKFAFDCCFWALCPVWFICFS